MIEVPRSSPRRTHGSRRLMRARQGHAPCLPRSTMRSKWRWRRLLWIPVLASAHACDCSDCFDLDYQGPSCALYPNNCGIGGQCAAEGNTCASGFMLDTTTTCDDAGTFCCYLGPDCAQVGGICLQPVPGLRSPCVAGTLQGYCGDNAACCNVSAEPGDGASDAAQDAPEPPPVGSCNGMPCASGCDCEPSDADGGGAVCMCAVADAATDGEPESALDEGAGNDAGEDASSGYAGGDGAVDATILLDAHVDAAAADGGPLDAANDAADDAANDADAGSMGTGTASACGVIACGNVCTCVSQAMSACVCP